MPFLAPYRDGLAAAHTPGRPLPGLPQPGGWPAEGTAAPRPCGHSGPKPRPRWQLARAGRGRPGRPWPVPRPPFLSLTGAALTH